MKIEQAKWSQELGWNPAPTGTLSQDAQLILAFGAPDPIRSPALVDDIRKFYPRAIILGGSSAGEIMGPRVLEDSIVLTAIQFEHTLVRATHINLTLTKDSHEAGEHLAAALPLTAENGQGGMEKLVHVLIISEGLDINGSDLITGLTSRLPKDVAVTGGLAGDGVNFKETLVFCGNIPVKHSVSVVGLYGSHLKVGYGSLGGWDSFGPERMVTKSRKNVLYELDGKPALELYKQYLGDQADKLPASGLFFPLSIRSANRSNAVVRAFLAFDEASQSMTFSGNIPTGSYARLMRSNAPKLIEGAAGAARGCLLGDGSISPQLALLISCVARKLVLTQRTEEEVEAVAQTLGEQSFLTGFYSYGEIAPFGMGGHCELHNQTMTITTFSEE